jgi:hypothetical protein
MYHQLPAMRMPRQENFLSEKRYPKSGLRTEESLILLHGPQGAITKSNSAPLPPPHIHTGQKGFVPS